MGLKITIQTNFKVVNFLDLTLNLNNGRLQPYRKPGATTPSTSTPDHPPNIIKHLTKSPSTRISSLSYNEQEFNKASQPYNDALKASGFDEGLQFVPETERGK